MGHQGGPVSTGQGWRGWLEEQEPSNHPPIWVQRPQWLVLASSVTLDMLLKQMTYLSLGFPICKMEKIINRSHLTELF